MFDLLSLALFASAATGLLLVGVQVLAVLVYLNRPRGLNADPKPISILKPLCGVDDDLATNLEHFATLDHPNYELLLGVSSIDDPAFELARACQRRHPGRVRVVLQRGAPGLNPKVNQLITLSQEARFEILLISDSNVRVRSGYLQEISAGLEDPDVGLVTHPTVGIGEKRLGSLLDNLHLLTYCAAGTISAKLVAGRDLVVGKSMAMRRADIAALGGFESVKDVLAEDYVLGVAIGERLGKRVLLGDPIENVSEARPVAHFLSRYQRWSVMQRKLVGLPLYCMQLLLNPLLLALLGFLLAPSPFALCLLALVYATRVGAGVAQSMLLRGSFPLIGVFALPLKDLLIGWAWLVGLVRNTVEWRGKRLYVSEGSRLMTPEREIIDEQVPART